MTEIFKIQRLGNQSIIAYTEDYSKYLELPNTPELATFLGINQKAYVRARILSNNIFDIVSELDNQKW